MLKSTTAFTYELDDPGAALEEIKSQLDEKIKLKKNSVGIIICDPEFIDSGILKAICDGLPFPTAGTTSMSQAVNGEAGMLILTIMVLTSDDVSFEVGITETIDKDIFDSTKASYEEAATRLPGKPNLALIFPPLILGLAGDQFIDTFETLCRDIPIFGTLAVEDSLELNNCSSFCNGESDRFKMSFILISGNISPRFFIATISDKKLLPYSGEITKSEGNIVSEINDVTASEYFESIGLAKNGVIDAGVQFLPFVLDFKKREDYDGVPVVRALVQFDEKGAVICRGNMYQNSVFKLSTFDSDDVLETTMDLVGKIIDIPEPNAIIMFSCMVRRMSFGAEPLVEAEKIAMAMNPDIPYMMAYSGGEICPTSVREDSVTNRFHNYTLVACVL